ncbi:hypothetical protein OS189_05395 [Sulfitobacter sp. F26169L]|uniref:FliH/SctL family protein n=1 Tax=Sulfitobacter sp. F26169L TaxID=2996015 RepID=UPI002260FF1C|nr:hypothetical protein [Sulfitobacter sp. F26169L]MCX7565769.1 hypothetical protein [Sulfitobacter sp. F26169L]
MTSIAHRYADFSPFEIDGQPANPVPPERVEDQKLQAFEEGYQAGWTDAEKNHTSEQKNIGGEFLHTLQDLSFTYQEALARLNRGLRPMFEQMIATLLPQTTNAALRAHVIEQLTELAATQTSAQITLRISDSNLPMLEDLLEDVELKLPVLLAPDRSLSPNQLFVSLDTLEREVNLDAVCQEIISAMNAFNFHSQTERPND